MKTLAMLFSSTMTRETWWKYRLAAGKKLLRQNGQMVRSC